MRILNCISDVSASNLVKETSSFDNTLDYVFSHPSGKCSNNARNESRFIRLQISPTHNA